MLVQGPMTKIQDHNAGPRSNDQDPRSYSNLKSTESWCRICNIFPMPKITRFEDLEAWKYARELTKEIFRITRTGSLSQNFRLSDQMRSASVSVMNNIAEGFERGGDKEFHNFLSIAKGSAGEVRSQLYVVLDQGYIDSEEFKIISDLTSSISRQVSGLMKYLRRSEFKGSKFK